LMGAAGSRASALCVGDCNDNHTVVISELVTGPPKGDSPLASRPRSRPVRSFPTADRSSSPAGRCSRRWSKSSCAIRAA
jgi:hypothetical protein